MDYARKGIVVEVSLLLPCLRFWCKPERSFHPLRYIAVESTEATPFSSIRLEEAARFEKIISEEMYGGRKEVVF